MATVKKFRFRFNYGKLLRDERWKNLRKKIIARDSGECTECNRKVGLQVHHTHYEWGLMPWEYPHNSLVTLCKQHHNLKTCCDKELQSIVKSIVDKAKLLGFAKALFLSENRKDNPIVQINNEEECASFASFFGINYERDDDQRFLVFLSDNDFKISYSDAVNLGESNGKS